MAPWTNSSARPAPMTRPTRTRTTCSLQSRPSDDCTGAEAVPLRAVPVDRASGYLAPPRGDRVFLRVRQAVEDPGRLGRALGPLHGMQARAARAAAGAGVGRDRTRRRTHARRSHARAAADLAARAAPRDRAAAPGHRRARAGARRAGALLARICVLAAAARDDPAGRRFRDLKGRSD